MLTRRQLARATIDVSHPLLLANADSRDLIRRIPPQSVDLILTDPPYIVAYRSRVRKCDLRLGPK